LLLAIPQHYAVAVAMSCSTVTLAYRFPSLQRLNISEGRFSEMMARLPTLAGTVPSEITPTFIGTMLSLVFFYCYQLNSLEYIILIISYYAFCTGFSL
jgi:hypothetical protein